MTISERDFRGVDLNLLVAFLVLMRERSVSRAAEQLYLGQPAMSGALARLRSLFDDELLVRTAAGMEPTPRALRLEAELLPALQGVQAALFQSERFDPARAERTFTLAMPDWVEVWLMPGVFAELRRQAPGMRIAVKATDPFQAAAMLERHEMELGIATLRAEPGWMRSQPLAKMGFSCVHHAARLRFEGGLSLSDYIAHPHLLVTYRGVFQSGIDQLLAEQGLQRRVQYTTQQFSALPSLLREVEALASVPSALAHHWADCQNLHAHPLPLPPPEFELSMFWHAVKDRDPALQWLRGLVAEAARQPARAGGKKAPGHIDAGPA
ncbi:LysR family transcriptional regulator [Chromobacterium sp. ASV23]|uniref:LysR family transcriptional regulator n=1 Tax=Chromobacterium sp. ASV23 TaxID=2795110 RepID=UPI0018EB95F7|nr:LysR family transcriptional regulator [Chromobacterium sp. ASV23]